MGCVRANGEGGNREKETGIEMEREGGSETKERWTKREDSKPRGVAGGASMVRRGEEEEEERGGIK